VRQLAADDQTPPGVLCAKIAGFLSNWLGNHIESVDRKVIAFITAKQAGAAAASPGR
jgi:hemerythrin